MEYLGKREYSYQELGQKLQTYATETDDIAAILEDFKARGWLSDKRFTEQLVRARQNKFGSAKIVHELREKGVSDQLIEEAAVALKQDELSNARMVWQKKYNHAPTSREEWAKQARFLQSRGFGFETIKRVLNSKFDDDN